MTEKPFDPNKRLVISYLHEGKDRTFVVNPFNQDNIRRLVNITRWACQHDVELFIAPRRHETPTKTLHTLDKDGNVSLVAAE